MANRRLSLANIQLKGREWDEVAFELQRFLEALNDTQDEDALPPGDYDGLPLPIALAPAVGDPTDGWSPGKHVHTAEASQVSVVPVGNITETDVQGALTGLDSRKLAHRRTMIRVAVWR